MIVIRIVRRSSLVSRWRWRYSGRTRSIGLSPKLVIVSRTRRRRYDRRIVSIFSSRRRRDSTRRARIIPRIAGRRHGRIIIAKAAVIRGRSIARIVTVTSVFPCGGWRWRSIVSASRLRYPIQQSRFRRAATSLMMARTKNRV
jgi:hypothetical protein